MTDPRRTAFGGFRAAALLAALAAFLSVPASHAQDERHLTRGDALVTGFSGAKTKHVIDIDGASLRVLGLPNKSGAKASAKFSVPARQIGQVFGIALDDAQAADGSPTPNAYVTATSLYGLNLAAPNAAGTGVERTQKGRASAHWTQGQWGDALKGGPGSIYKIDGETGEATLFATIALDKIPNSGPGLGNISFDARSQNLYVSDRESGMIFRLDLKGNVLGEFDHGVFGRRAIGLDIVSYDPLDRADIKTSRFRSDDAATYGLPAAERRIFGLAAWRGRLYYAVADGPQIWSLPISADGSFGKARFEVNLPDNAADFEVSDIAFMPGGDMLLALRGAPGAASDYSGKAAAKGGQVLRYQPQAADDEAPGHWRTGPSAYYIGQSASGSSGDGGVALSAAPCAGTVWATGSALTSGRAKIDGLQGMPADSASETPKPVRDPLTVDFDNADPSTGRTGYLGDVAIVRTCEGGPSGYSETQLAEAKQQRTAPQGERETQDGRESGGPDAGGGPGAGGGLIIGGGPGGGGQQPADPLDGLTVTKSASLCRFGETCGFNITFQNTGDQDIAFEGTARDELRSHHDGVPVNASLLAIPGSLSFCSATPNGLPFSCTANIQLAPGESHTFAVMIEMNDAKLDPADPNNHGPGGVVQVRNCFALEDRSGRTFGPACTTVIVEGPDAEQAPEPVAGRFGLHKTCGAIGADGKAICQVTVVPSNTRIEDAISVTVRDEASYRTDSGGTGIALLLVRDFGMCARPSPNVVLCPISANGLMPGQGVATQPWTRTIRVDRPQDATQGVLKNCVTLEVWGPGDQRLQEAEPAEACADIALDAPPAGDLATIADLKIEKTLNSPCSRRPGLITCAFVVTLSNPTEKVFNGPLVLSDTPSGVLGGQWHGIANYPAVECIVLARKLSCTGSPKLEPGGHIKFGGYFTVPRDQQDRTQFENCAVLADGTGLTVQEHCIDVPLTLASDPAKPALTVRKKGPADPCPEDGDCVFTVEIANEGAEPFNGEIGLVDRPVLGVAGSGNLEVVRIDSGVCTEAPAGPVQSLACRVPLDLGPQGSGTDIKSFRVWVRPVQEQVQSVTEGRNCVTIGTPALADTAQGQAFDPEQTYHHACAGFELEIAEPTVPELTKTAASETCVYGGECTFEVTIKNPSDVAPLILDGVFSDRPWSGFFENGIGPFDSAVLTVPIVAMDGDICGDAPPLSAIFHCWVEGYTLAPGEQRSFTITLRLNDPTLNPDGPLAAGREVRVKNCLSYTGAKYAHGCSINVQIVSALPEGLNEKDGVRIDKTCPVCAEGKICRCDIQVTVPRDVPRLSYLTVNDVAGSSVDVFSTFVLQGEGTDAGWSCPAADDTSVKCVLPALALRDNENDPRVYNLAVGVGRKEGRTDSIENCAILNLFDNDSRPLSDSLIHCAHVLIRDVDERVAELPVREPEKGCADGFDWDEAAGRCTPDGSWNPEEEDVPLGHAAQPLTEDDGCPAGFYRDETRGRCRPGDGPGPTTEPESPAEVTPSRPSCTGGRVPSGDDCVCPSGTEWSAKAKRCREVRSEEPQGQTAPSRPSCPSGTSYDPDKRKCVSNCRIGQTWDAKRKRCVTPPTPLTCLNGGEVRGKICWCGFGRFPFAVQGRKNTFECKTIEEPKEPQRDSRPEPKEPQQESTPEPKEPSITCTNGTVKSGKCRCRKGFVLEKTGPTAWKCYRPYEGGAPAGTSSGKGPSTSGPSGGGASQTRPNASTPKPAKPKPAKPKPAKPKPPSNTLVCRGGKVKGSLCWCGLGKFPKKVPGTANTWQCR